MHKKMDNYLKKQILISSCIYLGQILVGYSLGWSAPIIPKLQDPEQTPLPEAIGDGESSWAGTLLYIGCVFGPYLTSYISNAKGRKPCLLLGGAITLVSYTLLALASNIIMIYVGRICAGAGVGIIAVINLVYIGEIASTNIRGILLTMTGFFNTFGTLIVYAVGPYVPYAWASWLAAGLTAIYIAGIFTIPETPMFQVIIGQQEKAKETLISLGRQAEVDEILLTKQAKSSLTDDWIQIFSMRTNRKALSITLTLSVLQQLSGVVAVTFFVTSIFEFAGSSIEPNLATIIIGITQILASVITPFFVDRTGRKSLLLYSTAACFISLAVLGMFFWLDETENPVAEKIKWLPLVSLIFFFIFYDFGFGIIPNTLTGEMFTANVRSSGSILVVTAAYLVGFGVSTAFSYMLPALGGAITFWVFTASCAVAFLFTLVYVPETKGKSLIEIMEILSK